MVISYGIAEFLVMISTPPSLLLRECAVQSCIVFFAPCRPFFKSISLSFYFEREQLRIKLWSEEGKKSSYCFLSRCNTLTYVCCRNERTNIGTDLRFKSLFAGLKTNAAISKQQLYRQITVINVFSVTFFFLSIRKEISSWLVFYYVFLLRVFLALFWPRSLKYFASWLKRNKLEGWKEKKLASLKQQR